jgi:hypothetical protein
MDGHRFDDLTRALAVRLPRRLLGGLAVATLAAVGGEQATAKRHGAPDTGKNAHRREETGHPRRGDDHDHGRATAERRGFGKASRKSKGSKKPPTGKPACVVLGGSCKKPRKGTTPTE